MTTTLSTVFAIIHAETGAGFITQDQWWESVFYSFCHAPGNENLSNACVSKYRCGRRKISNEYLRFYSAIASLRVPVRLVADLSEYLKRHASVRVPNGDMYCASEKKCDLIWCWGIRNVRRCQSLALGSCQCATVEKTE